MRLRRAVALSTFVLWGCLAAGARADTPVPLCVPSSGGAAVTTPSAGSCPGGSTLRQLADQTDLTAAKARIAALETLLTGVTRGTVSGHPTLRISGENVQIVN